MNIRITHSEQAEERIAAVAITAFREAVRRWSTEGYRDYFGVDYADISDAIKEQVRIEMTRARIAEAQKCERPDRVKFLEATL